MRIPLPWPEDSLFGWDIVEGSVACSAGKPADETQAAKLSCGGLDSLAEGERASELACTERAQILCGRHGASSRWPSTCSRTSRGTCTGSLTRPTPSAARCKPWPPRRSASGRRRAGPRAGVLGQYLEAYPQHGRLLSTRAHVRGTAVGTALERPLIRIRGAGPAAGESKHRRTLTRMMPRVFVGVPFSRLANLATLVSRLAETLLRCLECATSWPLCASVSSSSTVAWAPRSSSTTSPSRTTTSCPGAATRRSFSTAPTSSRASTSPSSRRAPRSCRPTASRLPGSSSTSGDSASTRPRSTAAPPRSRAPRSARTASWPARSARPATCRPPTTRPWATCRSASSSRSSPSRRRA